MMKKLMERLMKRNKKKGQSLVEYGLILALVAVIAIAALQLLGDRVQTAADTAGTTVQTATTNAGATYCAHAGGTWTAATQQCKMP